MEGCTLYRTKSLLVGYAIILAAMTLTATRMALAHPTTQPTIHDQLMRALNKDVIALAAAIPDDLDASNRAEREKVGATAIPIIKHAISLIDQLPPSNGISMSSMKIDWEPMLIVFGDKNFTANQLAYAQGSGVAALNARLCLSLADLTLAGRDAAKAEIAAKRILDDARTAPKSDYAAHALLHLGDDERLSAETKSEAIKLLAESESDVGGAVRLANQMSATRPAQ
jgi:hypothetical protein